MNRKMVFYTCGRLMQVTAALLLLPAVTALIAMAVYNLCKVSLFVETDAGFVPAVKTMILAIVVFFAMQNKKLKKLHPACWLLAAAVIGVAFRF